MKMQSSPIKDGALQVTTPSPAFKPVTVELTFESLEELLVMKTVLGFAKGKETLERITEWKETKGVSLNVTECNAISLKQYEFFDKVYCEVVGTK